MIDKTTFEWGNKRIPVVRDVDVLAEKMNAMLTADLQAMGAASLNKIQPYTIENMARVHAEIFETGR